MSAPKPQPQNTGQMKPIRDSRGHLLGKYDPRSGTLEIRRGGETTRVNLREMERR